MQSSLLAQDGTESANSGLLPQVLTYGRLRAGYAERDTPKSPYAAGWWSAGGGLLQDFAGCQVDGRCRFFAAVLFNEHHAVALKKQSGVSPKTGG